MRLRRNPNCSEMASGIILYIYIYTPYVCIRYSYAKYDEPSPAIYKTNHPFPINPIIPLVTPSFQHSFNHRRHLITSPTVYPFSPCRQHPFTCIQLSFQTHPQRCRWIISRSSFHIGFTSIRTHTVYFYQNTYDRTQVAGWLAPLLDLETAY